MTTDTIRQTLKELCHRFAMAAFVAAVLWKTNPSHVRHEAKLYPGKVFGNAEPVAYRVPDWGRRMDLARGPKTAYHDHILFSTTTNNRTGARGTIGFFGCVFDLRTERQKKTEDDRYVHAQAAATEGFEHRFMN